MALLRGTKESQPPTPRVPWVSETFLVRFPLVAQGAEESYLTVMLAKFIAQIDFVNLKQ